MKIHTKTLVSDIVASNYKSATVFKKHKIDFCCNGNRSIDEVCTSNNLNTEQLIDEINNTILTEKNEDDYQSWNIDFLSDYIYNKHHNYVEKKVPEIKQYLEKICNVHGDSHPELFEINSLFTQSANELTTHMKKEELILFPYFKKLAQAYKEGVKISSVQFDTVESPIKMMHKEHDDEGHRFRKIAELSSNYTPPKDSCNTYKVTFALLKEFEEDLHKHIHLENNILFKKAIKLEQEIDN